MNIISLRVFPDTVRQDRCEKHPPAGGDCFALAALGSQLHVGEGQRAYAQVRTRPGVRGRVALPRLYSLLRVLFEMTVIDLDVLLIAHRYIIGIPGIREFDQKGSHRAHQRVYIPYEF
jgi:hypothetical protein